MSTNAALPWLLEPDPRNPGVRYFALRDLLGRPALDPDVREARAAVTRSGPVPAILDAQHPDGYWAKPGGGHAPSYCVTVWQIIFLADLGRGDDPRLANARQLILDKCDEGGRWPMEKSLNGKMWADIEVKGEPSKWVTLRALKALGRS